MGRRRIGARQIIVAAVTATDDGTYLLHMVVRVDPIDPTGRLTEDPRAGIQTAGVRARVLGGKIVTARRMCQ